MSQAASHVVPTSVNHAVAAHRVVASVTAVPTSTSGLTTPVLAVRAMVPMALQNVPRVEATVDRSLGELAQGR
jgi:hypothetical protein